MAETETPQPRPRTKLWLRVVLFASLALNLVIVGVIAGAAWRHAGPDGDRRLPRTDKLGAAYIRALSDEDKRAIRDEMRAQLPGRTEARAQMRDSFGPVLDTLRADSFDRAAMARQIEAQFAIGTDRQRLARSLMLDRIAAMSVQERRAFADRVADQVARMSRRWERAAR